MLCAAKQRKKGKMVHANQKSVLKIFLTAVKHDVVPELLRPDRLHVAIASEDCPTARAMISVFP